MNQSAGPARVEPRNAALYFVRNRQVAWVLLVATLIWGVVSYAQMPKRKDPYIRQRVAVAIGLWPGASADKVEQLITRKIEELVVQNPEVERVESTSSTGIAYVYVTLNQGVEPADMGKTFDDVELKLRSLRELPPGALPVQLEKDFGDTAALLLTVASPKVSAAELAVRAEAIGVAIGAARRGEPGRASVVWNYPAELGDASLRRAVDALARELDARGLVADLRPVAGAGFYGFDVRPAGDAAALGGVLERLASERPPPEGLHPDVWSPLAVADLAGLPAALEVVAGDAYGDRQLDDFTAAIGRRLKALPFVAKVSRVGVRPERVYLDYSQRRLAASAVSAGALTAALTAHNARLPGGTAEAAGRTLPIEPSGEFDALGPIGDVLVAATPAGAPVYVRDVVDVERAYESPARALNEYTYRDGTGRFRRSRAVTLAVQPRPGANVAELGRRANAELAALRRELPEDLVVATTSDQAQQVDEKIGLFLRSLYEAVAIVVLVALIGFRGWRSALVLALSIPVTLAMTFGLMRVLGIDVQTTSLVSLIIALGLLVDDPVVAADAIQRELDAGRPRELAAWLGPTKLGRAILFATLTNVAAYLPFLLMSGDVGRYIYSFPVVVVSSLVASRVVSMTFIPLLGYAILRPGVRRAADRERGAAGAYRKLILWAMSRRYRVLAAVGAGLVVGGLTGVKLRQMFFPTDSVPLSYVDVFLPEGATIESTRAAAAAADEVIREVAERHGRARPGPRGEPRPVLRSVTSFLGTPAPRFWYSLAPKEPLPNYAQLLLEVYENDDSAALVEPLQRALSARLPGVRLDVKELEHGAPVAYPVEVRLVGDDVATLRALGERVRLALARVPLADRVRDNWGPEGLRLRLRTDALRASLAGVTHADIALATATGFSGTPVGVLREGDRLTPIVTRLRADERSAAADLGELYVSPAGEGPRVPLGQVAALELGSGPEKIARRDQRRCLTVAAFPVVGALPSEVVAAARPALDAIARDLPPGYRLELGGTHEKEVSLNHDSNTVAAVSMLAIALMLLVQFRHAVKPLLVFAAIPFGAVGAIVSLVVNDQPFGFSAVLGVTSLIGVIVSHVVVLFDAVEEANERGEPLRTALLEAGTARLRPVLVTVAATVLGLVPLALHGGTLWQPLCYAQIGGLTLATLITLLLVPVLYVVFVEDLKIIAWNAAPPRRSWPAPAAEAGPPGAPRSADWSTEITKVMVRPAATARPRGC
ncbi:MAG: efflux RND transporter permease subunit [Polyangiaceae bacterium]|nr:efflux RND transporter permease subunit [Polyangiaceae bacterium]